MKQINEICTQLKEWSERVVYCKDIPLTINMINNSINNSIWHLKNRLDSILLFSFILFFTPLCVNENDVMYYGM